jgi:uncharacterized protein YxeA
MKTIIVIVLLIAAAGGSYYFVTNRAGSGNRYYNSYNKDYYLELRDDGTFYDKDMSNMEVTGKYNISGTSITLRPNGGLPARYATVSGNTITDPDGDKWVKE